MDKIPVIIMLGWVGLLFGSFAGAQVWRLRVHQLVEDKNDGEHVDAKELARLKPLLRSAASDRSECLHCHHRLAWYDLLPLISWLSLAGKCRYCRTPIGYFEPFMELSMALLFIVSYIGWPWPLTSSLQVALLAVWLVACVFMMILFAYDAKWSLLPFAINIALICIAVVFMTVKALITGVTLDLVLSQLLAIGILAGLYFVFSLFGWVGLGDSILGIGLALLLGRWELAFLALFLANFFGCLTLVPMAIRRVPLRGARIPFGPMLIAGTVVALLWGNDIIGRAFFESNVFFNMLMV